VNSQASASLVYLSRIHLPLDAKALEETSFLLFYDLFFPQSLNKLILTFYS